MRFNEGADLDTSQVSDQRGMGGRLAVGGGGLGIVGLIIYFVIGQLGGGSGGVPPLSGFGDVGQGQQVGSEAIDERCRTGADANREADCRAVAFINSIQAFWTQQLDGYRPAQTNFFDGSVQTGCGNASSAVGPFYCPADSEVYIDLNFFTDLRQRFGATGGPFVEAYVLAHEYGHHVQHLLGTSDQVGQSTGPTSGSVRLELQADCYAGVWASNAVDTGFIEDLTDQDIADGLDAAAAIGDDRIQERATGRVDPESWTHGSSASRQKWFSTGYRTGDPNRCNTFAADAL